WPDLKDYTVYASQNGGDFYAWRRNTIATADTFAGRPGPGVYHYRFYSIARDTCNNVEATPAAPQDTIEILATPDGGDARPGLALEGANPNPAFESVSAWFTLPDPGPATLDLIDVSGRRVLRRDVGALGPGRHAVMLRPARPLEPGLYFLRLVHGG